MEKKTMPVLMPDFYKDFHCVAAGCRNNCCVYPWQIFINKKNYKELRALKEPKWLTENFGSYVQRNPQSDRKDDYAMVRQDEHGCAFQTEEGLCRLQMDAGARYLSVTCNNYPRLDNYLVTPGATEAQLEKGLTTSCEEVVRILLHKPEPIQFVTDEEQYSPANFDNESRHASNFILNKGDRPMLAHYSLIRAVGIAVLQNRDYTIEQRLMLLTLYLDKLSQAETEERAADVPAITDTFVQAVDERLYDTLLAADGGAASSTIMSNIAFATAFNKSADHRITAQCDANITTLPYQTRLESYRAFTIGKEHFIEHLLVMEFFGKALPFKSRRSIYDCAQYLVSVFTIFRFMLGAYLGEAHTLPENDFIDFVAFFGKATLHTETSFDRNIALLQNNDMNTLPHLMSIVLG